MDRFAELAEYAALIAPAASSGNLRFGFMDRFAELAEYTAFIVPAVGSGNIRFGFRARVRSCVLP